MIQTWRNSECCYVTSGYALYIRPVTFELTALFEEKQPGEPTPGGKCSHNGGGTNSEAEQSPRAHLCVHKQLIPQDKLLRFCLLGIPFAQEACPMHTSTGNHVEVNTSKGKHQ